MRAPNHLEIKQQCKDAINGIFKSIGRAPPAKVYLDDQGWVNPCIFADDLVVRFNARDTHLPKFQREKIIFDQLRSIIPVPVCLKLDDSRALVPFDFMICEKIDGENLEKNWATMGEELSNSLAYQAGKLLAIIHSVELPSFGEISKIGIFSKPKSWPEYLRLILNYHLDEAMQLGLFTEKQKNKFLVSFEKGVPLLDQVKTANLIHGDFHFGNLLYSDKKIAGVLDFEWACSGDPLYDLTHLRDIDSKWPGSQDSFNQGYEISGFSAAEVKKMKIYTMIKNVELCVVAKKFFTDAEAKEFVEITIK
ncbi:MAG: aminoglycoside phosphotransferase family protein [Bdellovibrio sp.]|nr:aminoglycoside phosphotransferase family protein [Bdellovibrio sp.]